MFLSLFPCNEICKQIGLRASLSVILVFMFPSLPCLVPACEGTFLIYAFLISFSDLKLAVWFSIVSVTFVVETDGKHSFFKDPVLILQEKLQKCLILL